MFRPFEAYVRRLDAAYRDRTYFSGQKARLLAAFNLLMLVFVPFNAIKLFWFPPPHLGPRLLYNLLFVVTALFSLRELPKGNLERAGNGVAIMIVCIVQTGVFFFPDYVQPLGVGIQILIMNLVFLLFAIVFASRMVATSLLFVMVAGHVGFHLKALQQAPIAGALEYAAGTLLRDGLLSMCFIFCLGITLARMIETAHQRSEESLRETRSLNENLERLVSERTRELETVTQRATEASRAKSEFLANMSHEIRTPLNGIIASADMLMRRPDLSPAAAEHTRLISESGDLLLKLLGDILDFSKIEAGQLGLEKHPFELVPMVADTVAVVATKAAHGGVQLNFALAPNLPSFLEGDSYRIRQVLFNLLSNAIKFTPAGGRIQLTVDSAIPKSNPVSIRFEVRDTGIGMDAVTLGRIFERFTQADSSTTRRYGGSGLGLAISSRLVQMMGGRLQVESSPGQGSVFHFDVPLRPVAGLPQAPVTVEPLDTRLDLDVLVAEDNPVNRKILGAQLTQLGCRFVTAVDGEETLAALQLQPLPDVVLMDCHMPNLDGWEATRQIRRWSTDANAIRQKAAALPIIALTAAALPEERRRCIDAGMNDFIAKPVKLAELQRVLLPLKSRSAVPEDGHRAASPQTEHA